MGYLCTCRMTRASMCSTTRARTCITTRASMVLNGASTCRNARASTCITTRASTCITTRASTIEHHTSTGGGGVFSENIFQGVFREAVLFHDQTYLGTFGYFDVLLGNLRCFLMLRDSFGYFEVPSTQKHCSVVILQTSCSGITLPSSPIQY